MSEKNRYLQWFDQARAEMRSVLEVVDPGWEVYPGWRMRENIAHITGWEEVTIKSLRAYLDGGEPYLLPVQGIDAHNADLVAVRQAMTLEDVLREWEETRGLLKSTLAELPESDLEKWITFPWGEQGTIKEMLDIIAGHEQEHARELGESNK